jgi:hypothetical protein
MPAAFQVSNTANTTVPAPPCNPRIAWTACHNKLVDDAVRRATRECHDKLAVRVQPWMVEMKNLRRISGDVAPTNVAADRGLLTFVAATSVDLGGRGPHSSTAASVKWGGEVSAANCEAAS